MGQYLITTLSSSFTKLAPYFIFLVGGYFIFVKLPFLFLKKSMNDQKKKLNEESKDVKVVEEKYSVDEYNAFRKTMKTMKKEEPKVLPFEKPREEKKKEEQKKTYAKKEEPKKASSPEDVFQYKAGEAITKSDLKKRYFELLKQNHPDKVAALGADFKKLAEKNTKDINDAYEKLKKKAS